MGIQDGTRIKAHLRTCYSGIVERERVMQGFSATYHASDYWIIDCMLDIYTKPPTITTGASLVYWYFSTRVLPALLQGKTLVLIFDDCRRTPQNKAACQKKRRSRVEALPDGLFVSDGGALPDWYRALGSGKYRPMIFEYLLMGIASRIESVTVPHRGVVFANLPFSSDSFYDTNWMRGGIVELTRTGAEHPPEPIVHGEGDMLCRIWSDFFASKNPAAKQVIRSKDLDMVGIYSAKAPQGDCHLHLTTMLPKKTKTKHTMYEFLRVRNMHSNLFQRRSRALSFTYALILAGSDYCEGVRGIAGIHLVRNALSSAEDEDIVTVTPGKAPQVCKKRLQGLLNKSSRRSCHPLSQQVKMYRRANWNLGYWMSNSRVPSPERYGGWRKEQSGFMLPVP